MTADEGDRAVFQPPRTRGAHSPPTSRTSSDQVSISDDAPNALQRPLRECRAPRHQRVSASSLGRRTRLVSSRSEGERPADPVDYPRHHRAVEAGNRLHPAETFLDAFPDALARGISTGGGSCVHRLPIPPRRGQVLSDMGPDIHRPKLVHEVLGVVAAIGAEG